MATATIDIILLIYTYIALVPSIFDIRNHDIERWARTGKTKNGRVNNKKREYPQYQIQSALGRFLHRGEERREEGGGGVMT